MKSYPSKIVVDTNIVFSAILNSSSRISQILISSDFQFYTPYFLRIEIRKHQSKIKKLTHLSEVEIDELEEIVCKNIRFVHHELIPDKIFEESEKLLSKTDPDDVPFVALAKFLKAPLWSGDKRLMKKVRATHFIKTIDTETLFDFLH